MDDELGHVSLITVCPSVTGPMRAVSASSSGSGRSLGVATLTGNPVQPQPR